MNWIKIVRVRAPMAAQMPMMIGMGQGFAMQTIQANEELTEAQKQQATEVIGALAGWIASMITGNNRQMGTLANIAVGIVGGLIGGFLMDLLGGAGVTGFNLWSLLVAVLGAVILLASINAFSGRK